MADEKKCPDCGTTFEGERRYCPSCGAKIAPVQKTRQMKDLYIDRTLEEKYLIEKLVGVGGMCRVYRAKQLSLNQTVCVKVLNAELAKDEEQNRRFRREAEAVSRLNHPNIVRVFDFGQDQETNAPYLVMEYVPGKTLQELIHSEAPLSTKRIVNIMVQILSALAEAHSANIVHRDLKPANIHVTDLPGTGEFIRVLDFGIAKILDAEGTDAGLTRAGVVCGTPDYMSPEQARGEPLDARCDIYAAGVILYRMATGEKPFGNGAALDIMSRHMRDEPTPPSRIAGADVTPALEAVILKALSKEPDSRQPDVLAFQNEMQGIDPQAESPDAAPVQQSPGTLSGFGGNPVDRLLTRWRKVPHRRWVAVGLGLLAILALVSAFWPAKKVSRLEDLMNRGQYLEAESLLNRMPDRDKPLGEATRAALLLQDEDPDYDKITRLLYPAIRENRTLLQRAYIRKALVTTLDQEDGKAAVDFVVKKAGNVMIDDLVEATTDRRYHLRWNSVNALKSLGRLDRADQGLVWIADLKYAGSCSTRKRAAQKLARLKDKRALKPLREAQKQGFLDNLCMGDTLEEAIRAIGN